MTTKETLNTILAEGENSPTLTRIVNRRKRKPRKLYNVKNSQITKSRKGKKFFNYRDILSKKADILELLATGKAMNLTEAARKLDLNPSAVLYWAEQDEDFAELVKIAREVTADDLETELRGHKNFIPQMMILKGLRPMYRENFKIELKTEGLEKLLGEIKQISRPKEE